MRRAAATSSAEPTVLDDCLFTAPGRQGGRRGQDDLAGPYKRETARVGDALIGRLREAVAV